MANIASVLQRFLFILAAALTAAAWPTASRAVEAGIFYTSGNLTKEAPGETPGLYLNANFALHLPTQAEESLKRGVALYFVTEFELTKKRWYWTDKEVASASTTKRLTYSLLTRKYHLGGNGLSLSFSSLQDALSTLAAIRHWNVAGPRTISGSFQDYSARLRFRLDRGRLGSHL